MKMVSEWIFEWLRLHINNPDSHKVSEAEDWNDTLMIPKPELFRPSQCTWRSISSEHKVTNYSWQLSIFLANFVVIYTGQHYCTLITSALRAPYAGNFKTHTHTHILTFGASRKKMGLKLKQHDWNIEYEEKWITFVKWHLKIKKKMKSPGPGGGGGEKKNQTCSNRRNVRWTCNMLALSFLYCSRNMRWWYKTNAKSSSFVDSGGNDMAWELCL